MGKRYKESLCAYCGVASAATRDHVVARAFFLKEHRENLPQVPACEKCNNAKARLEHYLTAVLPFGGRHDSASHILSTMVPKRLAENAKLHRSLRDNVARVWSRESSLLMPVSALPIREDSIVQLVAYIVRGLAMFHWGITLGQRYSPLVMALAPAGEKYLDRLFAMDAAARVREDLGNGTFVYEGAQGVDVPEHSVWRFQIYGGAKFTDPDLPGVVSQRLGAISIPIDELSSVDSTADEQGDEADSR